MPWTRLANQSSRRVSPSMAPAMPNFSRYRGHAELRRKWAVWRHAGGHLAEDDETNVIAAEHLPVLEVDLGGVGLDSGVGEDGHLVAAQRLNNEEEHRISARPRGFQIVVTSGKSCGWVNYGHIGTY